MSHQKFTKDTLSGYADIYLAFPGMGKTPLALRNPRYVDMDFGFYREYMKCPKEDEDALVGPFASVIGSIHRPFIVLSNEPKLAKYIRISKMFLPSDPKYSAEKMGVSVEQILSWIQGWEKQANTYDIPIIRIKVGLDHYLK